MAVISPVEEPAPTPAGSSSRTTLPKPPRRTSDFTYAQPRNAPRDLDATLASWDSVPLFMRNLPDNTSSSNGSSSTEDTSGTALEALQSLVFDATPDEVASQFKCQADEYFRSRRFREALGFYNQAVEANASDNSLLETIHANRAACQLELGNFASVLRDTSKVLQLNASNEKAYYRAGKALLALERYEDALGCLHLGVQVGPDNREMGSLKKQAEEKLAKKNKCEQERREQQRRQQGIQKALHQALLARGLWLESTSRPPDNPKPVHFDPQSLAPSCDPGNLALTSAWNPPDIIRTPLVIPVFFIYPQHAQSDFISDYHEDTSLSTYLSIMFPLKDLGKLPWDTRREYHETNLRVYASTKRKRLLKIGKKLTLRQVMHHAFKQADQGRGQDSLEHRDGLVMRDGVLSLLVVPKGTAEEEWVASFKAEREREKAEL
ncbi:hypothetical protein NDA14_002244 [Ustilago hordei]|uniref:Related to CNS1-cyclophilin seven suppressor n=1 Tax=Ustilago hordei TaxID=120017 RepID=I2G0K6_USTHO|nr:uncharacterized protein UHO2_03500 [Ustilago hordei]KAJ1044310.1 hypothetical protein NDA10_007517 [Ustilago hordei]KAJ1579025.1 hypothetical protein NDA15_004474 [Ustilago hordei]KAJ1580546.1 hypothetical protein NDA12_001568 [Ustilago hordei]KAJ1594921.1 hypothetical protein NDA14_002244 [Ustilago hordei]UTT91859.1 hypothetical protein NDA17_004292 [Ustilago hordei]